MRFTHNAAIRTVPALAMIWCIIGGLKVRRMMPVVKLIKVSSGFWCHYPAINRISTNIDIIDEGNLPRGIYW